MALLTNVYIDDIISIEAITMSVAVALPGTRKQVKFETRDVNGNLAAASSISIAVKDPPGSTRVVYDSDELINIATGKYAYYFTLPDHVIEGDWYVNISMTMGDAVTVKNVHFPVREV